ncbi:unnamed protein product, partial [Didymodactylos carnosus]
MDKLPINENGKIDRKQLPKIERGHSSFPLSETTLSMITTTPIEEKIKEIFIEAFHLNSTTNINLDASFGTLGGTSMDAMKAVTLIRQQLYPQIEIGLLYSNPSIRQLAKVLEPKIFKNFQHTVNESISIDNNNNDNRPKPSLLIETLGIILLVYHYLFSIWTTMKFVEYIEPYNTMINITLYIILIPCIQLFHYIIWKHLLFPYGMKCDTKTQLYSFKYYSWWFLNRLWILNSKQLNILLGTFLYNYYLRMCGAQIGKNVHIYTTLIDAPDLLEIKDSTFISTDVLLNSLSYQNTTYSLNSIRIGSNCNIGFQSVLYNGVYIEDNVSIKSMSSITGRVVMSSNDENEQLLSNNLTCSFLQRFCQLICVAIIVYLHSIAIVITYFVYVKLFYSTYFCISIPICWILWSFLCLFITLFLLKFII